MNALFNSCPRPLGKTRSMHRQRGLSLVEIGIVLLVVSLIVIGIYSKATSISDEARIQRAIDDVILLLTKASAYKADTGSYTDVGIAALNTAGYNTAPFADGDGENPWGNDYTLAVQADSDQIVVLTIVTDGDPSCARLSTTLDGLVHNQESVSCDADDDTVTVQAR